MATNVLERPKDGGIYINGEPLYPEAVDSIFNSEDYNSGTVEAELGSAAIDNVVEKQDLNTNQELIKQARNRGSHQVRKRKYDRNGAVSRDRK